MYILLISFYHRKIFLIIILQHMLLKNHTLDYHGLVVLNLLL